MKNEKNYFEIFFKFSLDFYRNNFVYLCGLNQVVDFGGLLLDKERIISYDYHLLNQKNPDRGGYT